MATRLVGNTHLIAGDALMIRGVLSLLEKEGVKTGGNPDIYVREYRAFGINEARELRERASSRAVSSARRMFIIATPGMTNEAQNALLKTLEEPPADAMFFFIVPAPEMLLSTLRSRAQTLVLASDVVDGLVNTEQFLASSPQKRLAMLKPLLEKDEDDKRDMGAIIAFLSSLERQCEKRPEAMPAGRQGRESIYRARKYIGDKGALIKPLLEQVALLIPVV